MNQQLEEPIEVVRPKTIAQGCAYLLALALYGILSFVDAIPYHVSFYAWSAWHFTGGQIVLGCKLLRLHLEQQAIRRGNPFYRKR